MSTVHHLSGPHRLELSDTAGAKINSVSATAKTWQKFRDVFYSADFCISLSCNSLSDGLLMSNQRCLRNICIQDTSDTASVVVSKTLLIADGNGNVLLSKNQECLRQRLYRISRAWDTVDTRSVIFQKALIQNQQYLRHCWYQISDIQDSTDTEPVMPRHSWYQTSGIPDSPDTNETGLIQTDNYKSLVSPWKGHYF